LYRVYYWKAGWPETWIIKITAQRTSTALTRVRNLDMELSYKVISSEPGMSRNLDIKNFTEDIIGTQEGQEPGC
jgi:hypothetical protein